MDSSDFNIWLSKLRDKYISIKTPLDAYETPDEMMQKRIIDTFLQMEDDLKRCKIRCSDSDFHLTVLSAVVKYELGKVYFWKSPDIAEKYFNDAWDVAGIIQRDTDYILLVVCILNERNAMAMHKKTSVKEAKDCFKLSQKIWTAYEYESYRHIVTLENLFLRKPFRKELLLSSSFDPIHNLHTVFRQSYSDSLAKNLLIAAKAILEHSRKPFQWSRTLFRLADMLIISQKFFSARYILSCANLLIIQDELAMRIGGKKMSGAMLKKCELVKAEVNDYWGCYAMFLLGYSWSMKKRGDTEIDFSQTIDMALRNEHERNFPSLSLDKVAGFEKSVTFTLASNHKEATEILSFGKKRMLAAQQYYLQNDCLDPLMSSIEAINNMYENTLRFDNNDANTHFTCKCVFKLMESKMMNFGPQTRDDLTNRMLFQLIYWKVYTLEFKIRSFKDCDRKNRKKVDEIRNLCVSIYASSELLLQTLERKIDEFNFLSDVDVHHMLHAFVSNCNAQLICYLYVENHAKYLRNAEMYSSKVLDYIEKQPQYTKFVEKLLPTFKENIAIITDPDFDDKYRNRGSASQLL